MIAPRHARSLLLAISLLAACNPPPETERHAFFALGTLVEISVHDPSPGLPAALRDVETTLLAMEQRWRAWQDGGLAAINRQLAAGKVVALDAEYEAGIAQARKLSKQSDGRFNPAIGRMVELWGFHQEERGAAPPPDPLALSTFIPPPTLGDLERGDNGNWHSTDPRLWLDMGAFAKGLAIEAAGQVLEQHGIADAIVNAGGDLKVLGAHGGRAWRIGVRNPRGSGVLAAIEGRDGDSVFTSGDYERFFVWEGQRFHHILDPASGLPARGVTSVTVIHPDAAVADAGATALFVAGAGQWAAVARSMRIDTAMLTFEDGHVELTPAMLERVSFEQEPAAVEVIAP